MTDNRPFESDDEDDTLLFEKLQEHVLQNYPNPQRIGCLDRTTLQTLVENPEKLNLGDPKYLHVFKCAECTRELIELRNLREAQSESSVSDVSPSGTFPKSRKNMWAALGSSFVVCILVSFVVFLWRNYSGSHGIENKQQTAVLETLDLSQAGAPRGGETSAKPLILPRKLVALHLILPYYSPDGHYRVAVTKDRQSGSAEAEGNSTARANGPHSELTVNLDLRSLSPGTYYLATTHEGDPSAYFYPLSIR